MEQKNFLLAMALIIGFLLLWSTFVVPRFPPPAPVPGRSEYGDGPESPGTMAATSSTLKSALAERGEAVVPRDTILHDGNNEIVFSPKGGAIRDWRINSKGSNVDLRLRNPDAETLPLATFPDAVFKITPGDRRAVMEATLANGLRVTKTLTLSPSGHLHQLSFAFRIPRPTRLNSPIGNGAGDPDWGPQRLSRRKTRATFAPLRWGNSRSMSSKKPISPSSGAGPPSTIDTFWSPSSRSRRMLLNSESLALKYKPGSA